MQAEPAFQAAEVFWMEMLVSTAFFSLLAAVQRIYRDFSRDYILGLQ